MSEQSVLKLAKQNYRPKDLAQIRHAIKFAATKHAGQLRDSGKPYVSHPLGVTKLLLEWNMDLASVLAGILHDTIEDTDTTFEELEKEFGLEVAELVEGLTKVGEARSGMKHLDQYQPQTADNLSKLLIATSHDARVIIVKLADRLHNLSDLGYKSPAKQKKIALESLEVFGPMADRLGMGQVRTKIEDLAFFYLEPKRYQQLQNLTRKNLSRSTRKLGKIKLEVSEALKIEDIDAEISGRIKSIYSLHKKMVRKSENIKDIHDLIALRVIVKNKEDCYRVLGMLHMLYQPMIARIKDYIAVPKSNGYQSLHTTVITPHKQIVEFQIRTEDMHEFAEKGLAASFHYNEQKTTKNYTRSKRDSLLPANMRWVTELQEVASRVQNRDGVDRDQLAIDVFKDRIFVYSPKGDIYNLPEKALPLDFAFLVHSDIGKHAFGFLINHKMEPFSRPLENGDIVEVLTKKSVQPKSEWLDLMTTSHAKQKLRAQLKKLAQPPRSKTHPKSPKP